MEYGVRSTFSSGTGIPSSGFGTEHIHIDFGRTSNVEEGKVRGKMMPKDVVVTAPIELKNHLISGRR